MTKPVMAALLADCLESGYSSSKLMIDLDTIEVNTPQTQMYPPDNNPNTTD